MERKVLGKGLGALMPEQKVTQKKDAISLKLSDIVISRLQPRKEASPEKMKELIASIKEKGVIQPLIVRPKNNKFEIVAGERRYKAAIALGFTQVPVIIKDVDDAEALQLALIENIQREELNAIEEAQAYGQLITEFGFTQEKIAKMVGKNPSSVSNTLRLLKLPKMIQDALRKGLISMGHARTILALESITEQDQLFKQIMSQQLSVRQVEQITIKRGGKTKQRKQQLRDPHLVDLEHDIQIALGTKARIIPSRKRGKIVLEYYSLADLNRIVAQLKKRA